MLVKVVEGMHRHSAADVLLDVRVPALVVAGGRDPWTPPALARQMAEAMPDAELHVFGEASHSLPIEEPDALEALVLGWLAERFPPWAAGPGRTVGRHWIGWADSDPTRPQPPTRARVGLLAGGLALVVAGVAVLVALASAAGLVGRDDRPAMDGPGAASTTAPGTRPGRARGHRLEPPAVRPGRCGWRWRPTRPPGPGG